MPAKKDPRITLVVTAALLEQLMNADSALKNSRMKPERKKADAFHALIVQCVAARAKVPVSDDSFLVRPDAPPLPAMKPGSVVHGERTEADYRREANEGK